MESWDDRPPLGTAAPEEEGSPVPLGASLPPLDEDTRARAQSAETERALNEIWAVASSSPLVALIRAGRFVPLMNDYRGARKWVTDVLSTLM